MTLIYSFTQDFLPTVVFPIWPILGNAGRSELRGVSLDDLAQLPTRLSDPIPTRIWPPKTQRKHTGFIGTFEECGVTVRLDSSLLFHAGFSADRRFSNLADFGICRPIRATWGFAGRSGPTSDPTSRSDLAPNLAS